tara:strand:- start:883 stop:1020 length:138 start_codon:yes stop_codon:yes gene_type:complete
MESVCGGRFEGLLVVSAVLRVEDSVGAVFGAEGSGIPGFPEWQIV